MACEMIGADLLYHRTSAAYQPKAERQRIGSLYIRVVLPAQSFKFRFALVNGSQILWIQYEYSLALHQTINFDVQRIRNLIPSRQAVPSSVLIDHHLPLIGDSNISGLVGLRRLNNRSIQQPDDLIRKRQQDQCDDQMIH
jgi:hypothetical protein